MFTTRTPLLRAEQGLEWLVLLVIVGAGLAFGLFTSSWVGMSLGALLIGILFNATSFTYAVEAGAQDLPLVDGDRGHPVPRAWRDDGSGEGPRSAAGKLDFEPAKT